MITDKIVNIIETKPNGNKYLIYFVLTLDFLKYRPNEIRIIPDNRRKILFFKISNTVIFYVTSFCKEFSF